MLVLSRKMLEQIVVDVGGTIIQITVVDIRGDKTRIGIDAPKDVPVHRREIYDAIQREKTRQFRSASGE